MQRILPIAAAACAVLACALAHASDIYQWTDEQGHMHLSDKVPDRYKSVAKHMDSRQFSVSHADQASANERAAKVKAQAKAETDADDDDDDTASTAAPQATKASGPSPLPANASCTQRWKAYFDSQSCYAQYQRRNAGPRAEAYSNCGASVQSPAGQCDTPKVN